MEIYILSCEKIENGGGIYAYDLQGNGKLSKLAYFACDRPMYGIKCDKGLCILLRQPFNDTNESGYFFIDEKLQTATEIISTKGIVACHLAVDNDDVYAVNYMSGNLVKNGKQIVQRVGKSIHPTRQTQPHTHFVGQTIDGNLAVADLGTDALTIYDKNLQLVSESKVPNGYGIRHLVFSKCGTFIYTINELIPSVSVFAYETGKINCLQTVKILCKKENASGAAIRLSDDGKYLYVSLREENALIVFEIDGAHIKQIQKVDCGGDSPRDFNIFGNALVCTNEKSNNAVVFELVFGIIRQIYQIDIKQPLCVLLLR